MKNLILLFLVALMAGCASAPTVQMTPLEIQSIQTREYETSKHTAFAATLSVFQDLGYIVESADENTGFITASSPTDSKFNWWTGSKDGKKTRVTSFVEELRENFSRVRLTFVNSSSSSSAYGQYSEKDNVILDSVPYEAAFSRIDNEIFVRHGTK